MRETRPWPPAGGEILNIARACLEVAKAPNKPILYVGKFDPSSFTLQAGISDDVQDDHRFRSSPSAPLAGTPVAGAVLGGCGSRDPRPDPRGCQRAGTARGQA